MPRGIDDAAVLAAALALASLSAAWGGLWAPWETLAVQEPGWAVAAALSALGPSAFAARLPGVVATAITAWLTFRMGAAWLGNRRGWVAAAVLMSCPLVILQGGRLLGDAPAMMFEAVCVAAFIGRGGRAAPVAAFVAPLAGLAWAGEASSAAALDVAARHVGLGLFPWVALLPGALGALAFQPRAEDGTGDVVAAWVWGGLLAVALAPSLGRAPLLTSAPAMALALAAWGGPLGRGSRLVAGVVFLLVAVDATLEPGGSLLALVPAGRIPASPFLALHLSATLGWFAWAFTEGAVRRSVAPALGMALTLAPLHTADVSAHLSRAEAVRRYGEVAAAGEPLLAYKLGDDGDSFHASAAERVERMGELRRRLVGPGRVFALVRRVDLSSVDKHFRRVAQRSLPVLDGRSSEVVLASNRLGAGEEDRSPLSAAVGSSPPARMGRTSEAVLEGGVSLLGADLSSAEVAWGEGFELTLHFSVKDPPKRRWRVFVHMERGAHRVPLGRTDHFPVGGLYGTHRWEAGEHIADTHTITVPWFSTPPGVYRLYAGLAQGRRRATVTPAGAHDGRDRVFVGEIRVKWL